MKSLRRKLTRSEAEGLLLVLDHWVGVVPSDPLWLSAWFSIVQLRNRLRDDLSYIRPSYRLRLTEVTGLHFYAYAVQVGGYESLAYERSIIETIAGCVHQSILVPYQDATP